MLLGVALHRNRVASDLNLYPRFRSCILRSEAPPPDPRFGHGGWGTYQTSVLWYWQDINHKILRLILNSSSLDHLTIQISSHKRVLDIDGEGAGAGIGSTLFCFDVKACSSAFISALSSWISLFFMIMRTLGTKRAPRKDDAMRNMTMERSVDLRTRNAKV